MEKIKEGVKILRNNVGTTFGPLGKNVIIHTPDGELLITKDGVTVANYTNRFDDPEMQAGIEIVRQAANRTLSEAGDGTSSTVILASEMIESSSSKIVQDINSFKRDALYAMNLVLKELRKQTSFKFDLNGIAKTSCNGNIEIAKVVTEIIEHCGINGHFEYEQSFSKDSYKLTSGYKFNRGYLSSNFINNPNNNSCEFFKYSNILIINEKLERLENIAKIRDDKPMLIVAEDFTPGFIQNCINVCKQGFFFIPVKLPEYGEQRQFFLEDLSAYTNAKITSYDKCSKEDFGLTQGFSINQDKTVIFQSEFPDNDLIQKRIDVINSQLKETSVEYKIKKLKERLSSLSSKNAVLSIYGATDTEFKERRDLYDDGLKACQNALQYGVLPGGGVALMKAVTHVLGTKIKDEKLTEGHLLILGAGDTIFNENFKDDEVRFNISKSFFTTKDLRTNKIGDARKLNILDSYKTVECTLINATSVALSILTSNLYINSFSKNV